MSFFSFSAFTTFLVSIFPVLAKWNILDLFFSQASKWNWYFTPSLSYIGQGIIMGPSTTLSMLLGSIVGWGLLGPLSLAMNWSSEPIDDWKAGPRGWILWIALGIMISESMVSLILIAYKEIKVRTSYYEINENEIEIEEGPILTKPKLLISFSIATFICFIATHIVFPSYITLLSNSVSIILGVLLSVLAVIFY